VVDVFILFKNNDENLANKFTSLFFIFGIWPKIIWEILKKKGDFWGFQVAKICEKNL
jgi:hypothetical protein